MIKSQIMKNETVQPNTRELEKLKEILPQYFDKEGNFKLDNFKEMLKSNEIKVEKEGYELKFLGKNYSKFQSGLETETVIVPDIEHNSKEENINSENMYIVGDNLDALKHLLKSYSNKIKCIYIDPPYNTGSDGFVYNDNFSFTPEVLSEKMGIDEEEAKRIIELRGKSSHSAWLTFMYSRLELARDLLTDDGVIFISIDDNEQANLKLMCDEIFGEENFIANIMPIVNPGGRDYNQIAICHEYLLCYSKTIEAEINEINKEIEFKYFDVNGGYETRELRNRNPKFHSKNRPNLFYSFYVNPNIYDEYGFNPVSLQKTSEFTIEVKPYNSKNEESVWRWGKSKALENINLSDIKKSQIVAKQKKDGNYNIYEKNRKATTKVKSVWNESEMRTELGTKEVNQLFGKSVFEHPKSLNFIERCIYLATANDKENFILDFFSGSATTSHAVMELNKEDNGNRKYIMVQLPEEIKEDKVAYKEGYRTIDEIGRERIKRAGEKIKEENPNVDCGFKLFRLREVEKNMIDKIIEFDPKVAPLFMDNYLEAFKYENTSGKDTILTTWLNEDGYGLIAKSKKVKLINYEIDVCNNSAYIIEQGITSEDIMKLIEMIEENILEVKRIVIYPYSISFNIIHELKNNIKQLHVDVELIERY